MRFAVPLAVPLAGLACVACVAVGAPLAAAQVAPRDGIIVGPAPWTPSASVAGGFIMRLVGVPTDSGPLVYRLKLPAGAKLEAHTHTQDLQVVVLRGTHVLQLGGANDSSKRLTVTAGAFTLIPAGVVHSEWWPEESELHISTRAPMATNYVVPPKPPEPPASSPRR